MQTSSKDGAQAPWTTTAREVRFENAHLRVVTEEVCTPARESAIGWTTVHRKSAVVIAAITREKNLVLVRQERIPIRRAIWEVPAGQIDDLANSDREKIIAVALRELREETGYQLAPEGELLFLGRFFSSPGFTDESAHLFLARPVEVSGEGHAHQESESIVDCRSFTPAELCAMIAQDEIRDANTLGICAKLIARGLLAFPSSP